MAGSRECQGAVGGWRCDRKRDTRFGSRGRLRGVDKCGGVRDLIVERLGAYHDSGLREKTVEATEPPSLSSAREVLQELDAKGRVRERLVSPREIEFSP